MQDTRKFKLGPLKILRVSWRDLAASLLPIVLLIAVAVWIAFHFVRPAPPDTITIVSGPEGSTLWRYAERYRKILARNDVTLKNLPSIGTLDNLRKLADPKLDIDIGFVQGGLSGLIEHEDLVSLGSVAHVPLAVFYRGKPVKQLSGLKGKRIAIGAEGSGTRSLALILLKANGIEPGGATTLLDLRGKDAEQALFKGDIDAVFLTGDSAAPAIMRELMHAPGIRLYDFVQAEAYERRFHYLSRLDLPPGAIDLGRNTPPRRLTLIAPTLELLARDDLHPALSDLLIEAVREVHGRAGLFQKAGEFPAPLDREYPISDDASRYYKSGKGFAYRHLPFWIASLADRTWVVLVPILVLLIPGLRVVPTLYGWRIKTRIYRRYGELMALERAALAQPTPEQRAEMLARINAIEKAVIAIKMPGAYADQVYVLREHINFVRGQLAKNDTAASSPT